MKPSRFDARSSVRSLLGAAALLVAAPAVAGIKVEVEGLDKPQRENVEQRLSIRAERDAKHLTDAQVAALHQRASNEIREALQPFGYYNPEIRAKLEGQAPDWKATYKITAGPPTLIDQVDFVVRGEGAADPDLQDIIDKLPLHHGEQLQHPRYDDAKAQLGRVAYAKGYLDARFTRAQIRVRTWENRADTLLTLETGPAYQFGEVTIDQHELDHDFVRRYVGMIVPGAPFDPQKLLEARFALTDLDYFQSVEAEPQRERLEGRRLPVLIRTTPRPKHHYEAGIGYGTDTGARLSAATEFRRLNSMGHKLLIDLRLSQVKDAIANEYRIPVGAKAGETLSFQAGYAREEVADSRTTKYNLGVSLSRIPGRWKRRYYLQFQHERSELGGSTQLSDLLIPGISLNRSELDDPVHARLGWSAFADVHGAHTAVVSDTSFLQLLTQLRGVVPLGERSRLLGRYEYGASFVADFAELPASQRFFAGGDQSVRGYEYQSLGPTDETGKVIGGKFLTTMSLEAETFPWEHWGFATFIDAGGAADDASPALSKGVGVGLRYRAPVGFVQVDVAHPLDGDEGGVRLHLGIRVGL